MIRIARGAVDSSIVPPSLLPPLSLSNKNLFVLSQLSTPLTPSDTTTTHTADRGQVTSSTANKMAPTMTVPITTKTRQRRAVLALCLMLLARGNCFNIGSGSQCSTAHAHASVGSSRSTRSRASSSSSSPLEPLHALLQEEGADGAEGGFPGLLRDVVIEKIEELGGGKVQKVRSAAGCFLLCLAPLRFSCSRRICIYVYTAVLFTWYEPCLRWRTDRATELYADNSSAYIRRYFVVRMYYF